MSTPKKLAQMTPSTDATVLYQPTSGKGTLITDIWVANATGSSATYTFYDVDNGKSPVDGNVLIPAQALAAGAYAVVTESIVLTNANGLWCKVGTAGAITVTVYGMEYSLRGGGTFMSGRVLSSRSNSNTLSAGPGASPEIGPGPGGGGFGPGSGG